MPAKPKWCCFKKLRVILSVILSLFLIDACSKEATTEPNNPSTPDTPSVPDPTPQDTALDDGGDLSIRFIHRLPEIDYVWNSNNPSVEGWPSVGQEVTWQAKVINWSGNDRDSVSYAWELDGINIAGGVISIPALSEASIELPWTWTFDRHILKFIIDPLNKYEEEAELNNHVELYTNAITVGFYVEQTVYNHFMENESDINRGIATFDDRLHQLIDQFNDMCVQATYNTSPNGVLDRVRIDNIEIVPDGALPLAPLDDIPEEDRGPWSHPNVNDRSVDLQWGFPTANMNSLLKQNSFNLESYMSTVDATLLHELGHARYLTDVYGFHVYQGFYSDSVLVKEKGELVAGSQYMPGRGMHYTGSQGSGEALILYETNIIGLMNQTYTRIDQHSAAALNLIAGHRAVCGNYNEPCNIAEYLNDLPSENRLTLKDRDGNLLTNADVKIYRSEGIPGSGLFYSRRIDDIVDMNLQSDANGQVLLGRNPFSDDKIMQDWEVANTTAIIRVECEGKVGYSFLDVSKFNLAYWGGQTEIADYNMIFNMIE